MSQQWRTSLRLALMAALLVPVPTHASQIAMGITNRGIYVQEYWSEGKPFYAIANLTGQQSHIVLRETSVHDDGRNFTDRAYGKTVLDCTAAGDTVVFLKTEVVTDLKGTQGSRTIGYIDVLLDEKHAGSLEARIPPKQEMPGKIITDSNMNYWGGGPDGSMWFEQDSMIWKSDRDITLTLAIVTNTGDVGFGPYDELSTFIGADPSMGGGHYTYDLPVPLLLPKKATCTSLTVSEKNGLYSVNSHAPSPERVNKVMFTFHTPKVAKATPALVSGFRHRSPGWGNWITRMVIVEP